MVKQELIVRSALGSEAEELSDLAQRSKAYWGYDAEFMQQCRAELTYRAADINNKCSTFMVAEASPSKDIVGFYALLELVPSESRAATMQCELDALFVDPQRIGQGIGRTLVQHALQTARLQGYQTMVVVGDPNAEPFYLLAGAIKVGDRESESIKGRTLPLFEFRLNR